MELNILCWECGESLSSELEYVQGRGPSVIVKACDCRKTRDNGRLCAAASELLNALKDIEKGCSFPEDDVQRAIRDRTRAAIAKVEGK